MDELGRELGERLRGNSPDPEVIRALLDSAAHADRVAAARSLGRREQRALYAAVEGRLPVQLADLVPPGIGDWIEVRHHGKNTLPAFTHFEKRFCRPPGDDREKPSSLYGYNFQTMSPLTGPGYFIAVDDPARGEVLVDYRRVPERHPDGWPEVKSNERGLSRFVYGFMVDTLRRVSLHVTIGSAARNGRDLGSWFVLVREDPAA
jgi:hypothetical protein